MVKTSFTDRSENFGSKWSTKGKKFRPKADAGEVRRLKQGLYAVKRDLLAFEMGAKQLPQWFYTRLRSKTGSKNENYWSSWVTAKNTDEQDEPYCRSVLRGSQDLQVLVSRGGRRRFLWTQQVDAAAGVGEEEETRGGDSNRARAEEQWREEEDGWLKAHRTGLFIRPDS